ncbi:Uncharacterised protein [Escherichia coli]|uniref:Uncharacterized protein n=1 Tax=Escherichia coli TaxID=562 RepID=A0A376CQS5_ECOLX|nr:Uncharacterised protein [Escherichia coli]
MSKIRFVTPPYRLVTLTSDINNIKEIYSDDELNRLLEAVKQNCLTRIVLGNVEKGERNAAHSVLFKDYTRAYFS